jgi:RNA polymerase sigma-70 factor (ECF subfamily)
MEQSDEELIREYLRGDEAAFGELTARHLKTVYSFAYRFVGNADAAEDIAQDTFLKAWKSLKKYRPETSKFKTWLLRIARNTAIDSLRKRKMIAFSAFENEAGVNTLAETIPDENLLPDALFANQQDAQKVAECVAQLSPKYREVLALYYTNHLTFDEIGTLLGKPTNTVKSQHRRGLIALRALLAPIIN